MDERLGHRPNVYPRPGPRAEPCARCDTGASNRIESTRSRLSRRLRKECAAGCCTFEASCAPSSGQASANARMYLRLAGEPPRPLVLEIGGRLIDHLAPRPSACWRSRIMAWRICVTSSGPASKRVCWSTPAPKPCRSASGSGPCRWRPCGREGPAGPGRRSILPAVFEELPSRDQIGHDQAGVILGHLPFSGGESDAHAGIVARP